MLRFALVAFAASAATALVMACGSDADSPQPNAGGTSSGANGDAGSSGSSGTSGSGTSGGTSGIVLTGTYCHKTAVAQCAYFDRCLPKFVEPTTCVRNFEFECEHARKYPGAENVQIADSCLESLGTVDCAGSLENTQLQAECVPKGALENGKPCATSSQCKTGSCNRAAASTCGTCGDFAGEGASCEAANCASGFTCVNKVCVARKGIGATCKSGECAFPNRCVGGTCTAPLENGSACTAPPVGDEDPCKHTCKSGVCAESATTFGAVGDSCDDATTIICSANSRCVGPDGGKKCVANAGVGEACDADPKTLVADCSSKLDCDPATSKCVEEPVPTCP